MRTYFILVVAVIIAGCSGTKDIAVLTPEEHFNYAMEFYNDEDFEEAINEFQTILLQHPGSTINDDAQYYLGMAYFSREQFLLGAYEYSKLIRDIPASPFVPESQFMLSECYYQLSPPYQLDQVYTKKAIDEFQAFIDFFPVNPKVEEAENKIKEMNKKLAKKEYESAVIYEKIEYFNASIQYYDHLISTYHDTEFAPMAFYNKIRILMDKNRISEALRDITEFLNRYPKNENAAELTKIQDQILSN
ncbi:MAG: outer membrane protein assembly factor BamD [Bacteroidetes bacterium]|nr:outer membrane protein assembly factor BamD [Bacteroidota bacterium]